MRREGAFHEKGGSIKTLNKGGEKNWGGCKRGSAFWMKSEITYRKVFTREAGENNQTLELLSGQSKSGRQRQVRSSFSIIGEVWEETSKGPWREMERDEARRGEGGKPWGRGEEAR